MMNFSKSQKSFVIQWIDHKFTTDNLFPCGCAVTIDGEQKVCETHVKAYKKWNLTPHKHSHICSWIEEWMIPEEQALLEEALKKH